MNAAEIACQSLDALASGDIDKWGATLDENIVMLTPFSPEFMPSRCDGRANSMAAVRAFFGLVKDWVWLDRDAYQTTDPEVAFITARSNVNLLNGKQYANQYCFKIRVRDGLIHEQMEFFNPLPVIATFAA